MNGSVNPVTGIAISDDIDAVNELSACNWTKISAFGPLSPQENNAGNTILPLGPAVSGQIRTSSREFFVMTRFWCFLQV
jgi:hypothetical protein